jgi:hypothetical protein
MSATPWTEFHASLADVSEILFRAAPDDATRTEGAAYLARLTAYGVERFLMGPERLRNGLSFAAPRIGGYNPDYRIASANLAPGGRYRLRTRLHGAYRIGAGVYTVQPDGRISIDSYRILTGPGLPHPECEVDLSIAPGLAPEDGLALTPSSNLLLIREIRLQPDDLPAEFSFAPEAAPQPVSAQPVYAAPAAEDIANGLTRARQFIAGSAKQFLHWSEVFAAMPNTMTPLDPELDKAVQGDPGTRYFSGYFRLRPGQQLRIEIPPFNADYWGVQATSHWLEPLPASHLNRATAKPDADGTTRLVIAAENAGHPNWLPTGGRSCGAILHRRINAADAPAPRCELRG